MFCVPPPLSKLGLYICNGAYGCWARRLLNGFPHDAERDEYIVRTWGDDVLFCVVQPAPLPRDRVPASYEDDSVRGTWLVPPRHGLRHRQK